MNIQQINNLRAALGMVLLTEFPAVNIQIGEEGQQDVLGLDRQNDEPEIAADFMDPNLRHIAFFPTWIRFYTADDMSDLRGE